MFLLYRADSQVEVQIRILLKDNIVLLQSRSSLKNIKSFLCKKKLVNNPSIPSTHAERKITVRSHKHSFTPYPPLSPYSPTDRMTDGETNTLAARGLGGPFFHLCCCVSFWFWWEIGLGFTYLP
jgi:hypothetical protein